MRGLQNICKKRKYSIHIPIMIWMLVMILLTSTASLLTAHATEQETTQTDVGEEAGGDMMQSLESGMDYLSEQADELWQEYGDEVTGEITGEAGKGFWSKAWEAIKDFFADVWKFIVDFVTGLVELIF